MTQVHRRRFLKIAACGIAAMAAPFPASAMFAQDKALKLFHWRGMALGAEASLQLYHHNQEAAHHVMRGCFAEIQRLERIFSLHQPHSAISQLNAHGALENAPAELMELMQHATHYGELTEGAFDITVQPLWQLYARHFADARSDGEGPTEEAMQRVLSLIDYKKIHLRKRHITFAQAGMGITLNGIAQGYITDKVTELLKQRGLHNILVEMGEMRALGTHPDNTPWHVGIKTPGSSQGIADSVALNNMALATSGGYGTGFDASGEHHHLFNPHTGKSAQRYRSVSVVAPTATQADALSTAFSLLEAQTMHALIKDLEHVSIHLITHDNEVVTLRKQQG